MVSRWRFPMEFTTSPVLAPMQLLSHHWSCKHQIDPGWSRYKRSFVGISRDRNYLVLSAPSYMSMEYSQGYFFYQILTGVHIQESRLYPLVIEETFVPKCFFPSQSSGTEWTGWAPLKERPRVERLAMSSRQWLVCPGNLGVGWLDTLFFVLHFCNIWLNFGHNRYLKMPNSCRLSIKSSREK